jgi:predicted RNA-binding protein Jag
MEKEREGKRRVEASGKNVEEAIAQGLAQLGKTRDEVKIEVLSEGSRGLFGLGAEEARGSQEDLGGTTGKDGDQGPGGHPPKG